MPRSVGAFAIMSFYSQAPFTIALPTPYARIFVPNLDHIRPFGLPCTCAGLRDVVILTTAAPVPLLAPYMVYLPTL